MPDTLSSADQAALAAIVQQLENAWNTADSDAFAAPFAEDADFVDIRADYHRSRAAIAAGHAAIFKSIYAGSTNQYTIKSIRLIAPDVALIHVGAELESPAGPLTGRHRALFSMLCVRQPDWQIAAFHNTLAPPAR